MRTLITLSLPVESSNKALKEGTLSRLMDGFIADHKPEAAYFFARDGRRTTMFVFDLKDPAQIPAICEPFFAGLNAAIEVTPVMNVEDLKTGLGRIAARV